MISSAALSHMIPSADENFADYFGDSTSRIANYPLTPAIAAIGLIFLLAIDRLFLAGAHSHSEVKDHEAAINHHHKATYTKTYSSHRPTHTPCQKNYNTITANADHHPLSSPPSPTSDSPTPLYVTPGEPFVAPTPNDPLIPDEAAIDVGFHTDKLNHSITDYNAEKKSAVAKAWVFLLAISVHSFLEGLGMGAEDNEDAFLSVLFAVLAHKCLEAFALGLSIFYAKFKLTVTCLMIFGYSLATPLGVLAGIAASSLSGSQNLLAGILVSLASGSFLYISLVEILPTELHKPQKMGWKLTAMLVGWFSMVLLAVWT